MGKTEGFTRCGCDASTCTRLDYIEKGDKKLEEYTEIVRVTSDGTEQRRILCPAHLRLYKQMAAKHDAEFVNFLNTGTIVGVS